MRFTKSLVLPALTALSLITPFAANAGPKPRLEAALPNLGVERTNLASEKWVHIRNTGTVASLPCHARIQLENGGIFYFEIWSLQAGEEMSFQMPAAKDGKPYSFTVTVDCDQEVAESDETDNVESLHYAA